MQERVTRTIALAILAPVVVLGAGWRAQAQDAKTQYPTMAPLDQYLIADQNFEIELARSAAPKPISDGAEVLVLGKEGYKSAVKGTSGFVFVGRRI